MTEERNPLVNQGDPTAGLAPNLTTDEPGTVGDRIPPIAADLEQAGGVDDEENAVDPFHSGGTSETISGTDVSSTNQARAEDIPPTPAHGDPSIGGSASTAAVDAGGSFAEQPAGGLPRTGEPYPAEDGPVGRATPSDTPAMAGAPSSGDAGVRPAVAVPGKPDGEVDTRT